MSQSRSVIAVFFIVLFTLSFFSHSVAQQSSQSESEAQNFKTAPDFSLKTMAGDTFTLSEHKGQVVVLNIWATWCGPCRKEIPDFIDLQKELGDKDVLFVGISVDKKGWSKVRPYAQKMEINYPIMIDNGTVSKKYGPIRAIPTSFIINKKGKVEYVAPGMLNKKKLKPILVKLAHR